MIGFVSTEAPFDPTEAPTEALVGPTEAPTEVFVNPTEAPTEVFVNPTEAPTQALFDHTEVPVDPTEAPITYLTNTSSGIAETSSSPGSSVETETTETPETSLLLFNTGRLQLEHSFFNFMFSIVLFRLISNLLLV